MTYYKTHVHIYCYALAFTDITTQVTWLRMCGHVWLVLLLQFAACIKGNLILNWPKLLRPFETFFFHVISMCMCSQCD